MGSHKTTSWKWTLCLRSSHRNPSGDEKYLNIARIFESMYVFASGSNGIRPTLSLSERRNRNIGSLNMHIHSDHWVCTYSSGYMYTWGARHIPLCSTHSSFYLPLYHFASPYSSMFHWCIPLRSVTAQTFSPLHTFFILFCHFCIPPRRTPRPLFGL